MIKRFLCFTNQAFWDGAKVVNFSERHIRITLEQRKSTKYGASFVHFAHNYFADVPVL